MDLKIFKMIPEKKFLCPILYPLDKDPAREWVIKYYVPDYIKGCEKRKSYKGLLNLITDLKKRRKLAADYMRMIRRGEPLPNYQGARGVRPSGVVAKDKTNVLRCCESYLKMITAGDTGQENKTHIKSKLHIFGDWLKREKLHNKAIGGIDSDNALDFMIYLSQERKLKGYTYNSYKSLLADIWDHYKDKIKAANPWKDIPTKSKNTVHMESYPLELQQQIMQTLPGFNHQLWVISQCIYYCAIRPKELRFLKVKHIDFVSDAITVPAEIAKSRKTRVVSMFTGLSQLLKEYIGNASPESYLFALDGTPGAAHVSKNYFARQWDKYRTKFEIAVTFKLYGAKHTGGKKLTLKTNAFVTKEHFHHTSLQTTESYINDVEKSELQFLKTEFPAFGEPVNPLEPQQIQQPDTAAPDVHNLLLSVQGQLKLIQEKMQRE